jgi:hypothetical protein
MKKLLLILFCLPLLGLGQNSLFIHDLSNSIVATKDPSKTIGIKLNSLIEDKILLDHPKEIFVNIPFFNNIDLAVTLTRFDITDKFLTVISKNLDGEDFLKMQPSIVSYKIMYKENSIGIMNFYNGIINSSFKIDNHQYEISIFNNQYILFEASNSINTSNFSCQVEEELSNVNNNPVAGISFLPVCIEFALEIDLYTRQTFNSDLEATNWALAIFAGVSQLYEAQTNASISVQSIYIWNITDPYAAYINDAGNMLNALASHWQNNNGGIARDLVHLLSKRNNTGTGGIAWLDALCSTSYGYAFSSYLNNDTTYSFPNPSYTWNLMVCAHEVGHNVGSPHTHSCNWVADTTYGFTGGGIDDCGVSSGSSSACNPAAPAPPGGFGTIMSYCHVGGSGIVLNFHNIVISQALNPGIANASCLSICSTEGCTDSSAYNYVLSAVTDDGSCCYTAGCIDPNALNYDSVACYDDGSCIFPIYGCTDTSAINYDSTAAVDDGSCCYNDNWATLTMMDSYGDGWNGNYFVMTNVMTGTVVFNSTCVGYLTIESGCLPDGCYDITVDGGTWQSEISWNLDDGAGVITSGFAPYSGQITVGAGSCLYAGCTNPSPTGAYVNELIHDRVRVNWDNMNDTSCMVTQYRIRYRELGTSTWLSKTMANSGLCLFGLNTTSKKIVGLTPSTTYEYYMKAWYCGGGISTWSAIQNFTTTDECENVINFAVSTPTTTKASFSWDTTGAYSFARIKLRVDTTGGVWTSAGGFGVFYPALTKDKNGLTPGTSYRAQARTWCDPTGGAYRSATWTPLVFWTQPTSVRLEGGSTINSLAIYPNPSRDKFNVSFTSDTKQDLKVRIMNVVGEELINDNLQQFIGEYTKQINLSDNAKGIYFLEIETSDGIINKKLIVQ